VFPLLYWGARAQNHRGHQSYGFVTYDGDFHVHKGLHLVPAIRADDASTWINKLEGFVGISNVRYATSGAVDKKSLEKNIQPMLIKSDDIALALSLNGNLVNVNQLMESYSYSCGSDAELLTRLLHDFYKQERDLIDAVKLCMEVVEGAFSVTGFFHDGKLFAFKDPYGIRPLCAGQSETGLVKAFSSESVGLDINSLSLEFELEPGELILADKNGFERLRLVSSCKKAFCAFEFAYFSRPDSKLGTRYVYEVREDFGRNLAKENPDIVDDADIIISMPETGDDAAFGFHEETGIPWERASRRHRYIMERAFILLSRERHEVVDKKINILGPKVRDKKVIVIDDSIVRGDTTKIIVKKLKAMGARKVHLLITFPKITGPCFYGIDMATYHELIGVDRNEEEIAEIIGADTVRYQSLENFAKATGLGKENLCFGCVTGDYPTPLAKRIAKEAKELFEKGLEERGRVYEVTVLH